MHHFYANAVNTHISRGRGGFLTWLGSGFETDMRDVRANVWGHAFGKALTNSFAFTAAFGNKNYLPSSFLALPRWWR